MLRETVGLGPLEDLIADPAVEEVMVNAADEVYVERDGRIERAEVEFAGEQQVRDTIERILAPTGRRVDELAPMADARLADGSRVNVVVPPLAVDGAAISIRRFGAERPGPDARATGSVAPEAARILEEAVRGRRTLLVTGGTGSGKTTLLNAVSAWIDPRDRVITIEDAAELRLRQPHVVRLESRPPSVEGGRGHDPRPPAERAAHAAGPDRDRRGPWTGGAGPAHRAQHRSRGALSTLHANSPEDALRRLETLALMAGVGLPHDAIRDQVLRGIDLVAHLAATPRVRGGSCRSPRWSRQRARSPCARSGRRVTPAVLVAALAGGLAAVAARDAARSAPAAMRWIGEAFEPLRAPARGLRAERGGARRLGLLVGAVLLFAGAWMLGPAPAAPLAACRPRRRELGARLPNQALPTCRRGRAPADRTATADALAAGRSARAYRRRRRIARRPGGGGDIRVRADLDLGAPLENALAGLRQRIRSPRVDSFCAVLLSQRIAGGDLVSLLRRYADAAAARDRLAADARPAPPRPGSPGLLVAAMPTGAAVLAELLEPGFVAGRILADPASLALLAARRRPPARRVRRDPSAQRIG